MLPCLVLGRWLPRGYQPLPKVATMRLMRRTIVRTGNVRLEATWPVLFPKWLAKFYHFMKSLRFHFVKVKHLPASLWHMSQVKTKVRHSGRFFWQDESSHHDMVRIGVLGCDSNGVSPRSIRVKHIMVVRPQNECIVAGISQVLVDRGLLVDIISVREDY